MPNSSSITCGFFLIAYGQEALVDRCLAHLIQFIPKNRIVLVDNNSPKSLAFLAKKHAISLLRLEQNSGYSGGCNSAIAYFLSKTRFDTCCILNSDIFFEEDFFHYLPSELTRLVHNTRLALIQPVLFTDKKRKNVENCGIRYFQSGLVFQSKKDVPHPLINGACMLFSRRSLKLCEREKGKWFEELYWSYAEDVEFTLWVLSRGFTVDVSPLLVAQHIGSQSFGRGSKLSRYLYTRNLLWTIWVTWDSDTFRNYFFLFLLGQIRMIIEFLYAGDPFSYGFLLKETYEKRHILSSKRKTFFSKRKKDIPVLFQSGAFPVFS